MRYVRLNLLMAGITSPVTWEDAWEIVAMRIKLGLAIHPTEWVDELVAERQAAQWEAFGPA